MRRLFSLAEKTLGASTLLLVAGANAPAATVANCFDHFIGLPMGSTSQCVDFNANGITPAGTFSLGGGVAEDNNAIFDAFNPAQGLPSNFNAGEPFRGSVGYSSTATTLEVTHGDRIGFFPNTMDPGGLFPTLFGAIGSQSKIAFTVTTTDSSTQVPIRIETHQDFIFIDPLANDTSGSLGIFFFTQLGEVGGPQIVFRNGSFVWDSDPASTANFIDQDYVGNLNEVNPNPSQLDGTLDLVDTAMVDVGTPLELNTLQSVDIFSDGFESGDTAAWTSNAGNTFVVTITSPNPNVMIHVIPEPSTAALLLPGLLLLAERRRRNHRL